MEKTLSEVYDRKNNSFDLARIILALMVIYSHSYPLWGRAGGDVIQRFSNGRFSAGSVAVSGFFVISGFLITQSIMNSSSKKHFLFKRILRIIPGFLACLCVCAFIIGPIFSELPLREYFIDKGNGPFNFVFKNITFNLFGEAWGIHDVFASNPFPSSINGSIWTLKWEVVGYCATCLFLSLQLFKHRRVFLGSTIVMFILYLLDSNGYSMVSGELAKYSAWFSVKYYSDFVKLMYYYMSGTCIYLYRDRILLYWKWGIALLCILVMSIPSKSADVAMMIIFPYLLISTCAGIRNISVRYRNMEVSYGLYMYSFPIQQVVCRIMGPQTEGLMLMAVTLILTLIITVVTWKLIDEPFLKVRENIAKNK